MGSLLRDVRYALSFLSRKPGFTLAVLSALILGIGANSALFSVVNSLLLRPLPYDDADRMVRLHERKPPELEAFPVSPGNFTWYQKHARSFEHVAAHYGFPPLVLTGDAGPEQLDGARVSASLFPLLGVRPALGQLFTGEQEERGRDRVVLLSDALWRRRFGADPRIAGRTITLSDQTYTVIGVMPRDFRFPSETTEAWVPLGFTPKDRARHGSHYLTVIAKLKEGTSLAQAQAEMNVLTDRLAKLHPDTNAGWSVDAVSWQDDLTAPMRKPLLILSAAVLFVLLIACVNVTNLLLSRAASRSREVSIRMTLGATRGRVVRQLLTESLLLALAGGVVGLLLAALGVKALSLIAPASLPAIGSIAVDPPVLAFTIVVAVLTAIVFGLAPALQQTAQGSSVGPRRNRLSKLLVVSEVGLALILLAGAGLLVRSFLELRAVDPGFDSDGVVTMNLALSRVRYREKPRQAEFFAEATRAVANVPGVRAAAVVNPLPFSGDMNYGFALDGQSIAETHRLPVANYTIVSADYFRVMNIALLRGRTFTAHDDASAPHVAIINQTLARRHFGAADPIGKRIYLTDGSEAWREIVGVVADVKLHGLDTPATPQVYDPFAQAPFFITSMAVRVAGDPARSARAIVAAIQRLDPNQPVTAIRTMHEVIGESMAQRRFSMTLILIFAGLALLLAAMGIYAVMSYSVSERTREIGIRLAIGAQRRDILRLVLGQGTMLVVAGVGVGWAAALALTRLMSGLLFGVTPNDWPTFAAVSLLLFVVAVAATYVPARRAMKLDSVAALRRE